MKTINKIKYDRKKDKNRRYDRRLEKVVNLIKKTITKDKEDDFLMFCVGLTGTGKSNLMLHVYELFDKKGCSVDYIGLDKAKHAMAMYKASKRKRLRFAANDEANVSKKKAMANYNNDLLDLYYSIRGERIFHWWNNPSIDMIDKPIINDLIKGMIFIKDKSKGHREYYYFTKKDLMQMFLANKKRLTIDILKNQSKKYCNYIGWFKEYKGKLKKPYEDMKDNRMKFKLQRFANKWGKETKQKTQEKESFENDLVIGGNI